MPERVGVAVVLTEPRRSAVAGTAGGGCGRRDLIAPRRCCARGPCTAGCGALYCGNVRCTARCSLQHGPQCNPQFLPGGALPHAPAPTQQDAVVLPRKMYGHMHHRPRTLRTCLQVLRLQLQRGAGVQRGQRRVGPPGRVPRQRDACCRATPVVLRPPALLLTWPRTTTTPATPLTGTAGSRAVSAAALRRLPRLNCASTFSRQATHRHPCCGQQQEGLCLQATTLQRVAPQRHSCGGRQPRILLACHACVQGAHAISGMQRSGLPKRQARTTGG